MHHWHIDPQRIDAELDIARLAGLDATPLILRGMGMDGIEHIVATHSLSIQSHSASDRRDAARRAMAQICLSVLLRLSHGAGIQRPDVGLVLQVEQARQLPRSRRLLQAAGLKIRRFRSTLRDVYN